MQAYLHRCLVKWCGRLQIGRFGTIDSREEEATRASQISHNVGAQPLQYFTELSTPVSIDMRQHSRDCSACDVRDMSKNRRYRSQNM